MPLVVQKYGGTSVGDVDRIRQVAQKVKDLVDAGNRVVLVLSARSGVTNRLLADARTLTSYPDARELDMLLAVGEQETIALAAIALHAIGIPAVSRTGQQAGIRTDGKHTRARIVQVHGGDIRELLASGKVVIVAGFQGTTCENVRSHPEITTLGRGGSDLSAIALAAALEADRCEICTDVDGVYTADPRLVPHARKIDQISYEEMLELASTGSKVMQTRAVEFAKNHNVAFEVRASFSPCSGTLVKEEDNSMERVVVRGVALDKHQVKVVIQDLPDHPGTAAKLFAALAQADVNVDMIVQNIGTAGLARLTFTVPADDAHSAEDVIQKQFKALETGKVTIVNSIAKLSVVGVGMRSHCGVAARLFSALAETGINIQLISTSEIKITVVIDADKAEQACRVVHDAFKLGEPAQESVPPYPHII